jgi:hypothetical protein
MDERWLIPQIALKYKPDKEVVEDWENDGVTFQARIDIMTIHWNKEVVAVSRFQSYGPKVQTPNLFLFQYIYLPIMWIKHLQGYG